VLREGFPTQATGVGVASPDGDTRRGLVPVAAPCAGDGEARKHALSVIEIFNLKDAFGTLIPYTDYLFLTLGTCWAKQLNIPPPLCKIALADKLTTL